MGLFSNMSAISTVQRIKQGETLPLSLAQITNMIINLPDAEKNLPADKFNSVYSLFNGFMGCTTKIPMNLDGYYASCVKIIKKFDAIAPYEKYSGGNELEFSFLMDEIRELDEEPKKPILIHSKTEEEYVDNLNLLEAHKIVNQYTDFLASDKMSQYAPLAIPETALPFYHVGWQNTLTKAAKIYISYLLLWTLSQERIEGIIDLMANISWFVPEEQANASAEAFKAIRGKNKAMLKNINLPKISVYPTDDIAHQFNQMLDYKNNVTLKNWTAETMNQSAADFCYTAYEKAGVPYKQGYDVYFYPFKALRYYAQDENLKQYFVGYEDYIKKYEN